MGDDLSSISDFYGDLIIDSTYKKKRLPSFFQTHAFPWFPSTQFEEIQIGYQKFQIFFLKQILGLNISSPKKICQSIANLTLPWSPSNQPIVLFGVWLQFFQVWGAPTTFKLPPAKATELAKLQRFGWAESWDVFFVECKNNCDLPPIIMESLEIFGWIYI